MLAGRGPVPYTLRLKETSFTESARAGEAAAVVARLREYE